MKMIDTHCHLDHLNLKAYQGSIEALIEQSKQDGVQHIIAPSNDFSSIPILSKWAQRFPTLISYAIGVQPSEMPDVVITETELMAHISPDPKLVAIGETGLDFYYNQGDLRWQCDRFRAHIRVANQLQRPLIIHCRNADTEMIQILKEEKAQRGVFHCFTGTHELAKQVLDLGFYISFSGILTFSNATELRDVAKTIPLDCVLVETDAPYLTPVPHRGKPNQPSEVQWVIKKLAELKNIDEIILSTILIENTKRLFPTIDIY